MGTTSKPAEPQHTQKFSLCLPPWKTLTAWYCARMPPLRVAQSHHVLVAAKMLSGKRCAETFSLLATEGFSKVWKLSAVKQWAQNTHC